MRSGSAAHGLAALALVGDMRGRRSPRLTQEDALNDLAIHPLLARFRETRLRDLEPVELLEVRRRWPAEYALRMDAEAELKRARHDAEVIRLEAEFQGWRREAVDREAAEIATKATIRRLEAIAPEAV